MLKLDRVHVIRQEAQVKGPRILSLVGLSWWTQRLRIPDCLDPVSEIPPHCPALRSDVTVHSQCGPLDFGDWQYDSDPPIGGLDQRKQPNG